MGMVTVDGAGSTWAVGGASTVGYFSAAHLSITGGGTVTAKSVSSFGRSSLLAIDVGRGSLLTVGGGTGTISNSGTVRILAGAGVPVGDYVNYSPISAGKWNAPARIKASAENGMQPIVSLPPLASPLAHPALRFLNLGAIQQV